MSLSELGQHARRKLRQFSDARRHHDWKAVPFLNAALFPKLPQAGAAPVALRKALQRDMEDILAGRWRMFGHLEIKVDDPPPWQTDYLAGKNLATDESSFKLNHRQLPGGEDIKLIWELNRWHQLARLAQAAWVLEDARAADQCVRWLEDWAARNPPFRGWNWTSALEAGLRLVQFVWIDALLSGLGKNFSVSANLEALRANILPPHVWFTWRYKSFGSSANNHLLGELAGLITAVARWPALEKWGPSLTKLQVTWERQVLAQFAGDGGNREQALHYHLFAFEFCWQARLALVAAGRKISPKVEERLGRAARFFWEAQASREPWDYGDSDDGFVAPLCTGEGTAVQEWRGWLSGRAAAKDSSLEYWLDAPPVASRNMGGDPMHIDPVGDWWVYPETGIGFCESGFWWLRWDLSPLGYLKTAAHGHLDAQHLSIWRKGVALIIDPGTGSYYADQQLRSWLASRSAHNGPCPAGAEYPKRLGPFLWAAHHPRPSWNISRESTHKHDGVLSELSLPSGQLRRRITRIADRDGWQVEDQFEPNPGIADEFTVRWQLAPGTWVKRLGERKFRIHRADVSLEIEASDDWSEVKMIERESELTPASPGANNLEGIVSPAFRKTVFAPFLKLTARDGEKPCLFRTTFLASDSS